ncbi:MAG: hypothetical protein PHG02_01830 [Oscillospiraceae bacterium]|nr:hypothetical protein [Oscillospiraceae bacterium]
MNKDDYTSYMDPTQMDDSILSSFYHGRKDAMPGKGTPKEGYKREHENAEKSKSSSLRGVEPSEVPYAADETHSSADYGTAASDSTGDDYRATNYALADYDTAGLFQDIDEQDDEATGSVENEQNR